MWPLKIIKNMGLLLMTSLELSRHTQSRHWMYLGSISFLFMLGNFHLELAFYGVIGTFINDSGVEYLLTESGILAEGSLMSFIRGKY